MWFIKTILDLKTEMCTSHITNHLYLGSNIVPQGCEERLLMIFILYPTEKRGSTIAFVN